MNGTGNVLFTLFTILVQMLNALRARMTLKTNSLFPFLFGEKF